MNILESKEDYLETIYVLGCKLSLVRSIDIVNELNYSKASVSIALKKLKELGDIIIDKKTGGITLTETGKAKALSVYEKHLFLKKFLLFIGVSENNSEKDACKIEHEISDETFEKMKEFYKDSF